VAVRGALANNLDAQVEEDAKAENPDDDGSVGVGDHARGWRRVVGAYPTVSHVLSEAERVRELNGALLQEEAFFFGGVEPEMTEVTPDEFDRIMLFVGSVHYNCRFDTVARNEKGDWSVRLGVGIVRRPLSSFFCRSRSLALLSFSEPTLLHGPNGRWLATARREPPSGLALFFFFFSFFLFLLLLLWRAVRFVVDVRWQNAYALDEEKAEYVVDSAISSIDRAWCCGRANCCVGRKIGTSWVCGLPCPSHVPYHMRDQPKRIRASLRCEECQRVADQLAWHRLVTGMRLSMRFSAMRDGQVGGWRDQQMVQVDFNEFQDLLRVMKRIGGCRPVVWRARRGGLVGRGAGEGDIVFSSRHASRKLAMGTSQKTSTRAMMKRRWFVNLLADLFHNKRFRVGLHDKQLACVVFGGNRDMLSLRFINDAQRQVALLDLMAKTVGITTSAMMDIVSKVTPEFPMRNPKLPVASFELVMVVAKAERENLEDVLNCVFNRTERALPVALRARAERLSREMRRFRKEGLVSKWLSLRLSAAAAVRAAPLFSNPWIPLPNGWINRHMGEEEEDE